MFKNYFRNRASVLNFNYTFAGKRKLNMADKYTPAQARYMKYFERIRSESEFISNRQFKCLVSNCGKLLCGKKIQNLCTHLKTKHSGLYETNVKSAIDPKILAFERLKLIQNCTEMVTVNGRVFAALNDSGFRKIMSEKIIFLQENGYGDGLSAPKYTAVKEYIHFVVHKIEEKIKNEVKNKFVSLMIDSATKNNRSIVGLNVQYLLDGAITIRCIGMIHMNESQSGKNLFAAVMKRLDIFGIKLSQLIAITSDNGKNMVSMTNVFNSNYIYPDSELDSMEEMPIVIDEDNIDVGTFDADIDDDLEVQLQFLQLDLNNADIESALGTILDDVNNYWSLLENLGNDFAMKQLYITGIRCGTHTFQLGVKDALEHGSIKPYIALCRLACKELRKKTNIWVLQKNNISFKLPRIDRATRWNSIHLMVRARNHCSIIIILESLHFQYYAVLNNSFFRYFEADGHHRKL